MADKATKRPVSLKSGKTMNFLENNHCGIINIHSLGPWLTFKTTQNWGPLR